MLILLACAAPPMGLRLTPEGNGPVVTVDWDAKPLANIPFPNDLATRPDPTSPTGLRLNIPLAATTHQEEEARAKIDQLTGFGTYAPITVGFSAQLDLESLAARHKDDPAVGSTRFLDDAVLLIDIDPDSPDYLQPVALDMGEGRYPADAARSDRYFPNDSRSAEPSLLFDTYDEDLDGDGALDWGEDLDNDGVLDVPNTLGDSGNTRDDLLSWYERQSHTLIVRPVRPLREETTYAVVVTNRVLGEDGESVRSPWEYVHHLRQTEALRPLEDALPGLGMSLDDVAFAWAYTTARTTGDLVDIHLGLHGEGPFADLAQEYPAGIVEALPLHEMTGQDPVRLPIGVIMDTLAALGLFEGESAEVLVENYKAFADVVVGGAFVTPYFLADRDDGGRDDADEWFELDPYYGTYNAEPQRVPFTCVFPKDVEQPYKVAIFGHGYGSSRFDFLGFSWVLTRMGMAACAADFPGHGPTLGEDEAPLIKAYLEPQGLYPFLTHLQDSRYRDLNNDGVPDSGGDQWTADAFHTRDMVRQAVVDWMAMVNAIEACGEGTMSAPDGERMSCDWDNNGVPDLGNDVFVLGGSLGGINAGVAAAVIPEVVAWAPIASGAGLTDVAVRTEIGGAVEAMAGRLMSPLILGYPTGDGGVQVVQMVNSVTDMVAVPIATLPSFPPGGRIVVENLDKQVSREGYVPPDGAFRVGLPADALDPAEKRAATGMPDTGPVAGTTYEVADNAGLGDRLRITISAVDGSDPVVLETFEADVVHEGVTMRAGSPLVAASHGLGHTRATPEVRRLVSALAGILEPGDPVGYASHYWLDPIEALGGRPVPVLLVPTPGDTIVNASTGIAHARAAGLIPDEIDPRYGMTVDAWLVQNRVIQGLEQFGPFTDANGNPALFDPDDLDDSTDGTGAPSDAPLRLTLSHSGGMGALRMPYVRTTGFHGFGLPEPSQAFDINTFEVAQIATFLLSNGQDVRDDRCLEDLSCPWIREMP